MIALRDCRYGDRETGQVVSIKMGQEVDGAELAKHKCDIEKLVRTKFLAYGEAPSDQKLRRGKK